MNKDKLIKSYSAAAVELSGLENEFKLCHIPFLTVDDVFGAVALQGSSGTGKTTIGKKLGLLNLKAGNGGYGIYSADKAKYEDFVGCPIPEQKTKEMIIYPMPNSIAEKQLILVDEINRATYENQEKWLSLISTRTVDGFHTKVRYIFTAMNPVLSDNTDLYEGVQPLDKALGERMICLIDVPGLGKISDPKIRASIIRGGLQNQTAWEPSEELVEAHKAYIERARDLYEGYKSSITDSVVNYIDAIQCDLRKETKNAISIEARRAQYILAVILATHALNNVTTETSLEKSAAMGLGISFPHSLWEQSIEKTQIKAAHEKFKSVLKDRPSALSLAGNASKVVADLQELVQSGGTKESMSKLVHQGLVDKTVNPLEHYCYAYAVAEGLKSRKAKGGVSSPILKEQEFARFQGIVQELKDSQPFAKYKNLSEKYTQERVMDKKLLPDFVGSNSDEVEEFGQILAIEVTLLILSALDLTHTEVDNIAEFVGILESVTTLVTNFVDLAAIAGDK